CHPYRNPGLIKIIMTVYFHPVNTVIGPAHADFKMQFSGNFCFGKGRIKYGIIFLNHMPSGNLPVPFLLWAAITKDLVMAKISFACGSLEIQDPGAHLCGFKSNT